MTNSKGMMVAIARTEGNNCVVSTRYIDGEQASLLWQLSDKANKGMPELLEIYCDQRNESVLSYYIDGEIDEKRRFEDIIAKSTELRITEVSTIQTGGNCWLTELHIANGGHLKMIGITVDCVCGYSAENYEEEDDMLWHTDSIKGIYEHLKCYNAQGIAVAERCVTEWIRLFDIEKAEDDFKIVDVWQPMIKSVDITDSYVDVKLFTPYDLKTLRVTPDQVLGLDFAEEKLWFATSVSFLLELLHKFTDSHNEALNMTFVCVKYWMQLTNGNKMPNTFSL